MTHSGEVKQRALRCQFGRTQSYMFANITACRLRRDIIVGIIVGLETLLVRCDNGGRRGVATQVEANLRYL